jgi:hemin uptake protein HemP
MTHSPHGNSDAPSLDAEHRIALTAEDRRVVSLLALRPQPEVAIGGDGLASETVNISDLVSAFALSEVGMLDGWILVDVPLELSSPAHVTELSAMLVGAGAEVGIVVGSDDGLGRVIGSSFTVQFRAFAPLSWHARVLATLSGFTVDELGDGGWSLCARSHCGADAWSAMQQLKLRRDVEWVAPTDAQQNAMNQTGEGAHP